MLADGTLGPGRVFADVSDLMKRRKGAPDGLKLDRDGNLWATGPGRDPRHDARRARASGSSVTGEAISNCAWGDDGSTLYFTSDMYLCRIRTSTKGAGW